MIRRQYVDRNPRIGVSEALLQDSGIIIENSSCHFFLPSGEEVTAAIHSILNISTGGIKLVVSGVDQPPAAECKVRLFLPRDGEEDIDLQGRSVWSEPLAGGHYWIGLELKQSPATLTLYRLLTGKLP